MHVNAGSKRHASGAPTWQPSSPFMELVTSHPTAVRKATLNTVAASWSMAMAITRRPLQHIRFAWLERKRHVLEPVGEQHGEQREADRRRGW